MSKASHDNTQALLEKWYPRLVEAEETQPPAPVTILTGEALDLTHFLDRYWEPAEGNPGRPGMKSAVVSGLIANTTAEELRELVVVVSRTHAEFRAVTAETLDAPVDRGMFLLSEMKQCLEFLFDDGQDDQHDAELERLSETHTDFSTHDGLALSLEGFSYYANKFRDQLAQLPEFDPGYIDESLKVAARLREQSALKLANAVRDQQRELLSARNRAVTLLIERVTSTRRAARFVYRHYPDIARLASSAYERRRRARRRAAETATPTQQEVTATA